MGVPTAWCACEAFDWGTRALVGTDTDHHPDGEPITEDSYVPTADVVEALVQDLIAEAHALGADPRAHAALRLRWLGRRASTASPDALPHGLRDEIVAAALVHTGRVGPPPTD